MDKKLILLTTPNLFNVIGYPFKGSVRYIAGKFAIQILEAECRSGKDNMGGGSANVVTDLTPTQ